MVALSRFGRLGGISASLFHRLKTHPSDLERLDRVALTRAVEAIRTDAVVNGTDTLTMERVDAEVASVRAGRRRK